MGANDGDNQNAIDYLEERHRGATVPCAELWPRKCFNDVIDCLVRMKEKRRCEPDYGGRRIGIMRETEEVLKRGEVVIYRIDNNGNLTVEIPVPEHEKSDRLTQLFYHVPRYKVLPVHQNP